MFEQDKSTIESAKDLIYADKASCVLIRNNEIVNIEHASGIAPIIALYEKGMLENAVVVDKIIGKAAACVMSLGGVRACYGLTVSMGAIAHLRSREIPVDYDQCTEYIINRRGDGLCPMEDAVKEIDDDNEAYRAIKQRLAELAKGR